MCRIRETLGSYDRVAPSLVNRKTRKSNCFLGRFSQTETELFWVIFLDGKKKRNRKTDSVFLRRVCFTDTAEKKRPKPTDISTKKRKTDRDHFHFRFTTTTPAKDRRKPTYNCSFGENRKTDRAKKNRFIFGSQPWSPHDTNTCTLNTLKCCLFYQVSPTNRPRNRPRSVRFRLRFFSGLPPPPPTETDRHFGQKPKNRPRPFSLSVHHPDCAAFVKRLQTIAPRS